MLQTPEIHLPWHIVLYTLFVFELWTLNTPLLELPKFCEEKTSEPSVLHNIIEKFIVNRGYETDYPLQIHPCGSEF